MSWSCAANRRYAKRMCAVAELTAGASPEFPVQTSAQRPRDLNVPSKLHPVHKVSRTSDTTQGVETSPTLALWFACIPQSMLK